MRKLRLRKISNLLNATKLIKGSTYIRLNLISLPALPSSHDSILPSEMGREFLPITEKVVMEGCG